MKIRKEWVSAAYFAVSIATYGHAASWRQHHNDAQECFYLTNRDVKVTCDGLMPPPVAGFAAAVSWPLYWSWVAFS